VDQLQQQAAIRERRRNEHLVNRQTRRSIGISTGALVLRALMLDERLPDTARDAGSSATMSHVEPSEHSNTW